MEVGDVSDGLVAAADPAVGHASHVDPSVIPFRCQQCDWAGRSWPEHLAHMDDVHPSVSLKRLFHLGLGGSLSPVPCFSSVPTGRLVPFGAGQWKNIGPSTPGLLLVVLIAV